MATEKGNPGVRAWSKSMWSTSRDLPAKKFGVDIGSTASSSVQSSIDSDSIGKSDEDGKPSSETNANHVTPDIKKRGLDDDAHLSFETYLRGPNQSALGQFSGKTPILEPIAIVGMAFKFPSGAESETAFWNMLESKKCASSEFPHDRMNIDAFYNPDPKKPHAVRRPTQKL
jgi:hypothetical protein